MKKTALLVAIIASLTIVPVASATITTSSAAKSTFALGLNVGTNTGVGFQYRVNRDFDVIGNVGFDLLTLKSVAIDAAANFKVTDLKIDDLRLAVTVGLGGFVSVPFDDGADLEVSVMAPIGLVYSFTKRDQLPLDLYLRVAPGWQLLPDMQFVWSGYIGALWRFD